MHYSLLDDAVLTVRFDDGSIRRCSLPDVFVGLADSNIVAFEALQAHQQQAWHSFLVQTAAMIAARHNEGILPDGAEAWRSNLLQLADGSPSAWALVVDDASEPAFMQPPIPEGSLAKAKYKADVLTPDQLDVLITSKNHDVKSQRINHPAPEHWIFALCTLQTMEGFLGAGNYGITRMNGGFSSRPMVGLSKDLTWGTRFRRDVQALLAAREAIIRRFDYDQDGHALLWLEPWDGEKKSAIPMQACDPFFVEICRRIRFATEDDELICYRTNSKAQRLDAPATLNGTTGDPWTPVEKKGAKALTVGEGGFTYRLLQEIFFGAEYEMPAALEFVGDEKQGAYLIARSLVRGQGKTDGLHFRIIPIRKQVASFIAGRPDARTLIARRARGRVELTDDVQRKVLYPSIAALLSSGVDQKVEWDKVRPWIDTFDRAIDHRFFESLWDSVEMNEEDAGRMWQRILLKEARRQFTAAEQSTPVAAIRRWRARSKAHSVFEGQARKLLPLAFDKLPEVAA